MPLKKQWTSQEEDRGCGLRRRYTLVVVEVCDNGGFQPPRGVLQGAILLITLHMTRPGDMDTQIIGLHLRALKIWIGI